MKTTKHWLSELTYPANVESLEQLFIYYSDRSEDMYETQTEALENAFDWTNTPQGEDYWYNVNKNLKPLQNAVINKIKFGKV